MVREMPTALHSSRYLAVWVMHIRNDMPHPNGVRHKCQEQIMIEFKVNGKPAAFDDDASTPLLWVLRDALGLTGTKYGCGIARCGACTVHLNGAAIRSCVTPVSRVNGGLITTIEGLSN